MYDLRTLKACSLTCHSWYIAAVPLLHQSVTFRESKFGIARTGLKPLPRLYELGLLPLAREVRVCQSRELRSWFMPSVFSHRDFHHFSAFANVQKLQLERVDIFSFIPEVERYFGQFFATLQSIRLFVPCCTPRQLSYFLSLFINLDDIEIRGFSSPRANISDTELVLTSAPKLRGRLVVSSFCKVEIWKDLIIACGGLRFRAMYLRNVADCAPLLLEACSDTLETLQFFPVDTIGKCSSAGLPQSCTDSKQDMPLSHRSPTLICHSSRSFGPYRLRFRQSLWDMVAIVRAPSWMSSQPSHPHCSLRLSSSLRTGTYLVYPHVSHCLRHCVQ